MKIYAFDPTKPTMSVEEEVFVQVLSSFAGEGVSIVLVDKFGVTLSQGYVLALRINLDSGKLILHRTDAVNPELVEVAYPDGPIEEA